MNLEGLPAEATEDGPAVLRREMYNSLKTAGVNMTTVEGIECFSKQSWYIVFKTRTAKESYKSKTINLHEKEFKLSSMDIERINYTWVRIFAYPLDANSDFLTKTMQLYGDLVSITDDVDGRLNIKTGIKHAQFKTINKNIPSYIYAGKYRVRISYKGQRRTCRNCLSEDHEAKDCTAGRVCRECGQPGHTKGSCPERRCFHSHDKGHESHTCPRYLEDFPGLNNPITMTNTNPPTEEHDNNETQQIETRPNIETPATDSPNDQQHPMQTDHQLPLTTQHPTQSTNPPIEVSTTSHTDNSRQSHPPADTSNTTDIDQEHTQTPTTDEPSNTEPSSHTSTQETHPQQNPPPNQNQTQHMDTEQLPDNTEESESEEEPPLKTQKTVTTNTTHHSTSQTENEHEQAPEETGKTATSKANKKSKSPRKKNKERKKRTTVVVSKGRSRNPFN